MDNKYLEETLNFLEKRCGELIKEKANTLEDVNQGIRSMNCILVAKERLMRLQQGESLRELKAGIAALVSTEQERPFTEKEFVYHLVAAMFSEFVSIASRGTNEAFHA